MILCCARRRSTGHPEMLINYFFSYLSSAEETCAGSWRNWASARFAEDDGRSTCSDMRGRARITGRPKGHSIVSRILHQVPFGPAAPLCQHLRGRITAAMPRRGSQADRSLSAARRRSQRPSPRLRIEQSHPQP